MERPDIRGKIAEYIEPMINNFVVNDLLPRADRVVDAMATFYPKDFDALYGRAIAEGYYPVILGNHRSHFDAFLVARLTHKLTHMTPGVGEMPTPFNGFRLLLAESVGSGHQGSLLKQGYEQAMGSLSKYNVYPAKYIRKKDSKMGVSGSNLQLIKEIIQAPKDGFGLVVLPEASVQAARLKHRWWPFETYGMQEPDDHALAKLIGLHRRHEWKVVYVLIGMEGADRILSPGKKVMPEGYLAALGLLPYSPLRMKVHSPILSDELLKTPEETEDFLMREIAGLLSPSARGVYRN